MKAKVISILTDKWLYISLAVIIGLFFIYRIAKGRQQKDDPTVPDYDPSTLDYVTDVERGKAESLADRIYKDLKGANVFHDGAVHKELLESSDDIVIATYSIFNQKYQGASGQTLAQWYDNEMGINWILGGVLTYNWAQTRASLLQRFLALQLA